MNPIIAPAPSDLRLWWPWALHHGVHPIVLTALYERSERWEEFPPDSWTSVSNLLFACGDRRTALAMSAHSLTQTQFLSPYVDEADRCDRTVALSDVLNGKVARACFLTTVQGLYLSGSMAFALRRGREAGRAIEGAVDRALRFVAVSVEDDDVYLYFSAMLVPVIGYDSAAEEARVSEIEARPPPPMLVPNVRVDGSMGIRGILEVLKRA